MIVDLLWKRIVKTQPTLVEPIVLLSGPKGLKPIHPYRSLDFASRGIAATTTVTVKAYAISNLSGRTDISLNVLNFDEFGGFQYPSKGV